MHDAQSTSVASGDSIASTLFSIAQYILIATLGLLPLFFLPTTAVSVGAAKTLFLVIGLALALVFYSLATLRSGYVTFAGSWLLVALWGIVLATGIAALLSGDWRDALYGDFFGVHTVAFITTLALTAGLVSLLLTSKTSVMRLYTVLMASIGVLSVFHVLRIIFGPDVLQLGVFTQSVASPVGSWNDLGLFFGFIVLIALVAVEQLPLTYWGRVFAGSIVAISLLMLTVINFTAVWWVLGLSGLVLLMYGLSKGRFQPETIPLSTTPAKQSGQSPFSISISAVVFVVSLLFIIGGSLFGNAISRVTDISYVEVRPSLSATVDVARSVYDDNALTGIGANKFADAWRLHKDRAINDTVFWNTNFAAGNGYLTTQFVNTGLLGIVAWGTFLALLLVTGGRMLFLPSRNDRLWYYIGASSFVAAGYLWGMFLFYVPGVSMLVLAAASTGVVAVAHAQLRPAGVRTYTLATDRRTGFALIAVVMVVIIAAVAALFWTSRLFYTEYAFAATVQNIRAGENVADTEARIAELFASNPNDRYANQIARYQFARLNALLALESPTSAQQEQFQTALENGLQAVEQAIALDPTEPQYHALRGSIYSVLATAGIDGSRERAEESFATARQYDPKNPEYPLLEAQLYARLGETEQARRKVEEAVRLKRNYTDALYFASQLEIGAGNTEAAIEATRAMVSLEPRNAARHYQLGVLRSSVQNLDGAISSFERAVELDPNYANARYFLGLAYYEVGRETDAIEQLEVVAELNPDNQQVTQLIEQIKTGTVPETTLQQDPIEEAASVTEEGAGVTPTDVPETDLLSPVNQTGETTAGDPPVDGSDATTTPSSAPTAAQTTTTAQSAESSATTTGE